MTHQVFEEHSNVYDKADLFFLPGHLEGASVQGKYLPDIHKIVWTQGVAFDLDPAEVEAEYAEKKAELPEDKEILTVILPGDTENVDGTMQLYLAEEAKALAAHISDQAGKAHIIVLNGPRTGKYEASGTGEKPTVIEGIHREGAPVDRITQAFVDTLGIDGQPHTLYDFRFGTPSMYKPVLGLMVEKGGSIFVAGESNSMLADMMALGLQSQVTAVSHGAMNELHHANISYGNRHQGLAYLDETFVKHEAVGKSGAHENANTQIAERLIAGAR